MVGMIAGTRIVVESTESAASGEERACGRGVRTLRESMEPDSSQLHRATLAHARRGDVSEVTCHRIAHAADKDAQNA